jgi:large subunit ribosomal protein L6
MSRVGNRPIQVSSGIEVKVTDGFVRVKGPKGELQEALVEHTSVELQDGAVVVQRASDEKVARAAHGLMRSLIANMVTGVTDGFEKGLEIVGVGYRAEVKGRELTLSVGYSHPVVMKIPEGLDVKAEAPTKLAVQGISKQKVGQFAAEIRRVRSPEPYKGKGIRYANEHVRRKVGKAAVGT